MYSLAVLQSAGSPSPNCKQHLSVSPRLPTAQIRVSVGLGTCPLPGCLIVSREPFSRLQATSFLCGLEITSCSGSSTNKLLNDIIHRSDEQHILVARCHVAMQNPASLSYTASTAVPVVHAETTHGLVLAGRSTLRRLDRASCSADIDS